MNSSSVSRTVLGPGPTGMVSVCTSIQTHGVSMYRSALNGYWFSVNWHTCRWYVGISIITDQRGSEKRRRRRGGEAE